jgi:hypothetical protein
MFDRPPGGEDGEEDRSPSKGGLDFLLVTDRATFDKMRSVINGRTPTFAQNVSWLVCMGSRDASLFAQVVTYLECHRVYQPV